MNLIFLLGLSQALVCVLAYTGAMAQQLVSDTSLQKFRTLCLMGTCVLEKTSLKRPWSNLQLIKELLICMFQICWNNLHWGNCSSIQASAITQPGSSQVLQSDRWWRVANASGNSGCTLSLLFLVLSHAWNQSSAGPKQDQTLGTCLPCPTGLCQALWVIFADLDAAAQPGCSPLPVCRTLGGCEGLPEFERCFLRDISSSCNVNL